MTLIESLPVNTQVPTTLDMALIGRFSSFTASDSYCRFSAQLDSNLLHLWKLGLGQVLSQPQDLNIRSVLMSLFEIFPIYLIQFKLRFLVVKARDNLNHIHMMVQTTIKFECLSYCSVQLGVMQIASCHLPSFEIQNQSNQSFPILCAFS